MYVLAAHYSHLSFTVVNAPFVCRRRATCCSYVRPRPPSVSCVFTYGRQTASNGLLLLFGCLVSPRPREPMKGLHNSRFVAHVNKPTTPLLGTHNRGRSGTRRKLRGQRQAGARGRDGRQSGAGDGRGRQRQRQSRGRAAALLLVPLQGRPHQCLGGRLGLRLGGRDCPATGMYMYVRCARASVSCYSSRCDNDGIIPVLRCLWPVACCCLSGGGWALCITAMSHFPRNIFEIAPIVGHDNMFLYFFHALHLLATPSP